jgi:2C-methyl-D-erythritol 2,4-cyclodiphosphate synthase
MPKKQQEPKDDHPTFLEGILPENMSKRLGNMLPGASQSEYKRSIDDVMFLSMVGALYYFQWSTQVKLINSMTAKLGEHEWTISEILKEIELRREKIERLEEEKAELYSSMRIIRDLYNTLRDTTFDQSGWPDENEWNIWKANKLASRQEKINELNTEWVSLDKEVQAERKKIGEHEETLKKLYADLAKRSDKIPKMDYISPLFTSFALAYMLKHSDGYGSLMVMGVVLAIISLSGNIAKIQEIAEELEEVGYLPALGGAAGIYSYVNADEMGFGKVKDLFGGLFD